MVYSSTAPLEDEPPSYDAVINSPICSRSFGSVQEEFGNVINQNHDVGNGDVGRNVAEFRSANRTHVEAFNDITDLNGAPILSLGETPPLQERSGLSERRTLTKKGLYWRLAIIISLGVFMVITFGTLIYVLVNSEKVNQRLDSIDQEGLERLKEEVKLLNGNWLNISADLSSLDYRLNNIKDTLEEVQHRIERIGNAKGIQVQVYRNSGWQCEYKLSAIWGIFVIALYS